MRSFGSARPCADFTRPPSCILARRACSVGFVSCETLGKHYHASLRLRSFGSARPCADFARPPSCILCTFMNALLVSHPCETLGVHFIRHPCLTRKLRVLAPAAPKKAGLYLFVVVKVGRGCRIVLALLVSHPCETLGKHYHASLRLRSFGSARPCADFARPPSCILCTFMNALLVSHHCLVSRLSCHIVWQLSAAGFKHPCLKLWAFIL